jgi:hypothetical protein
LVPTFLCLSTLRLSTDPESADPPWTLIDVRVQRVLWCHVMHLCQCCRRHSQCHRHMSPCAVWVHASTCKFCFCARIECISLSGQCTHAVSGHPSPSQPARLTCVGMGYDLHLSGMALQHASCPVYMTLCGPCMMMGIFWGGVVGVAPYKLTVL